MRGSGRESRWTDGGGGGRGFVRRVFGDGENPLGWSLPLYRAMGIGVRMHLFFIVYVVLELVRSLSTGALGFGFAAILMTSVFGLVLLHEYGHCFACRWTGGEADEVILWPLGGLAMVSPPHDWKSHLITVLGGPGVNAVLLLPLAGVVWAVTGDLSVVVFNPFAPGGALAGLSASSDLVYWAKVALWSLHYANMVLLAFNMLVPMYPMDAGRVVQAVLWRSMGYERSMEIAVVVGFAAAGVLALVGIVFNEVILLALAVFGGLVCWQERARLRFGGGFGGGRASREPWAESAAEAVRRDRAAERAEERAERAAEKRAERDAAERAEVDRILEKISREGMGSLTGRERRFLKKASEGAD